MEMLRESIGLHTCDQRRSKHYLHEIYPHYTFECSFSEDDQLWGPVYQETDAQQAVRLRRVLNEIWEREEATYISVTAHSGTVSAILKNVGHREFKLQTGGVIPVVVRGYHDVCFLGFKLMVGLNSDYDDIVDERDRSSMYCESKYQVIIAYFSKKPLSTGS
jgi:broad specificity phosphatase PhoE